MANTENTSANTSTIDITSIQTTSNTMTTRGGMVTTNEYKIIDVQESMKERKVVVTVELGPFTSRVDGRGHYIVEGTGRRNIVVWSGLAYDAVRDTWTNADLVAKVTEILNNRTQ